MIDITTVFIQPLTGSNLPSQPLGKAAATQKTTIMVIAIFFIGGTIYAVSRLYAKKSQEGQ